MTNVPEGRTKRRFLNIEMADITMAELLAAADHGVIFTPNIDHFVLLQRDREFYNAYRTAEYVVLDSQIIYLLMKMFRQQFKEKISGSDLFPAFCDHHKADREIRIFVLGGLGDVAERVKSIINMRFGREIIIEALSPEYDFDQDEKQNEMVVKRINDSTANVLAVGLGTPKQEKWIYQNRAKLKNINLFMGVGATFDFITGDQTRAPRWMQMCGLEWFYRLIGNPKRFAHRYLLTDMKFFYYFMLLLLKIYHDPFEEIK